MLLRFTTGGNMVYKGGNILNFEELKQLVAFYDYGTLSKVAEIFHISTPSVTRSMQNLEKSFGVSLFNRSKNRIELNETGQVAVNCARKLLQEANQMISDVKTFDERQKTIVVKSCAPAPLWEVLKKLDTGHFGMTISSSICQNEEVLQFLENDACDIAILPFPVSMPGWTVKEFMKEHLFVCVPQNHEISRHLKICWNELNGFNFLLRSELGFWDTLCREKMPASKFLVQTDESEFNELVRASSLPCFTTDYISKRDRIYPERVNIPIVDEDANVTFYLIYRFDLLNGG